MIFAVVLQAMLMAGAVGCLWSPKSVFSTAMGYGLLCLGFCWAFLLGAWVTVHQLNL